MNNPITEEEKRIHDTFQMLTPFTGVWKGEGSADFPTIEYTKYTEELVFKCNDTEPLLHFEQKTWHNTGDERDGTPLHWESGFIIVKEDSSILMVNSQNSERVEVMEGTLRKNESGETILLFESVTFANDERMLRTKRKYVLRNDKLSFSMGMATTKVSQIQPHLQSELVKTV